MIRLLSYVGFLVGFGLSLLTGILIFQRQNPSTAEWVYFSVAMYNQYDDVYRYNLHDGQLEQLTFRVEYESILGVDLNANNLYILSAITGYDASIYQMSIASLRQRKVAKLPPDVKPQEAFRTSPDKQWVLVAYPVKPGNTEIFLRDKETDVVHQITTTPTINEIEPVWSPDGEWILFVANHPPGWGLYRMRADGSQREALLVLAQPMERLLWLPPINEGWRPHYLLLGGVSSIGMWVGFSLSRWK